MWNPPWDDDGWRDAAHSWIDGRLLDLGTPRRGPFDQFHVRPWSTVIRVPAGNGNVYFKAGAPSQACEPAVLGLLGRLRPTDSPELLASNIEKSWSLTADGGQILRSQLAGDATNRTHFESLLPQFAELQLTLAGCSSDLLAEDVPDRRLSELPGLYKRLVTDVDLLSADAHAVLAADEIERLSTMTDLVRQLCDTLGSAGIPETVDHGDLHTANIFFRDGVYTFFDWGDVSLSHPFFSMTVMMRTIAGDSNAQDVEFNWARDAYLEPFAGFAPRRTLIEAFDAAQHLGRVQMALGWHLLFQLIAPTHLVDYLKYPASWMWLFLHFPADDL